MNEPNLVRRKGFTEKVTEKQKPILVIAVIGLIILFAGTSYSMLTNFDTGSDMLTFTKGDMTVTVNQAGLIEMDKKVPEPDEVGLINAAPVVLTLTNTSKANIMRFDVRLVLDDEKKTTLNTDYIKYSVSTDFGVNYSNAMSLKESANIIYSAYNISPDKSKTIYLKLWLDDKAPSDNFDKNYYGKIAVDLYENSSVPYASETIIKTLAKENGVVAINNKGNIASKDEVIREYRYSGSKVDNYVRFNNEIWRIIGVFDNKLKIVRDEILKEELIPETYYIENTSYQMKKKNSNGAYLYWNNYKREDEGKLDNDWTNTGISYYLNTEFDNYGMRGYLNHLSNEARSMLNENTYYFDNIDINNKATTKTVYEMERVDKKTFTARVALMYPSDYMYSFDNKYWNEELVNFDSKIKKTSWMYSSMKDIKNLQSWLLGVSDDEPLNLDVSGDVSLDSETSISGVRPSVYLNSDVLIIRGDGTLDNPYILSL